MKKIIYILAVFVFLACTNSETKKENKVKVACGNQEYRGDNIELALSSGELKELSEDELIKAVLKEIDTERNLLLDAKIKIFNLDKNGKLKEDGTSLSSISWDPTHDASIFSTTLSKNIAILKTNAVTKDDKTIYNEVISVIGKKENSNYMVIGSNPFRNWHRNTENLNEEMHTFMENSISWLTARDNLKETEFNVVIAHMDQSHYFPDENGTRAWLDERYPNQVKYNEENLCDGANLESCLTETTDLLIISQISEETEDLDNISSVVNKALKDGIAVLYLHHDGGITNLGEKLFKEVFSVSYKGDNYWKNLKLEAFNPEVSLDSSLLLKDVRAMFTHFDNKDYNFDWTKCDDEKCDEVLGLNTEFQYGATQVKEIVDNLDKNKVNIFNDNAYCIQKLLVLTADKLRQNVKYPMGKGITDDNEFMKAYFTDHVVYNYRNINPVQADMGNFSRSDFSHITTVNETIKMTSRKPFRSTGLYALPGKTVKITRNDTSDLTVKIFINTLRSGATHQFKELKINEDGSTKNGYQRPKYLQSTHIEVSPNETIEITSPYGGPIQVEFNKNDLEIELSFENIGKHPYWASSSDDSSFAEKLQKADYDWAEISTMGFEVHSKLDKMNESISDSKWGTAKELAAATQKYINNYPLVLTALKGEGVGVVDEIHDFALENDLNIKLVESVKHMNADQATCGYGCSGNPYDAYWAFSPIGHGDIHEVGHSLERSMFRFDGWEGHSTTNPYSYYTKSKYFELTGQDPDCQNLPFKEVFEKLQLSVKEAAPIDYLKTNLWESSNWSHQVLVLIQAMMHSQKMGKLVNGWHLLARLHLLERGLNPAKEDWNNKKSSIGFSQYSIEEINDIDNNDWMLVSLSYASSLDFSDYLTMMGITYSTKALNQVKSFNYTVVPKEFFVSTPNGYCKEDKFGRLLDKTTIEVDGLQAFPE